MWRKMTEHESRGVRACSYRSERSSIQKEFDVGVFFGTFESRGLVSSRLLKPGSCKKTIIVLFEEAKNHPLRRQNDKLLLKQVARCSRENPSRVRHKSIRDIEGILSSVLDKAPMSSFGPRAEWFIDIAGAPIPYFLALLGILREKLRPPKLLVFHPTADYEKSAATEEAYSFTSGPDSYIWVPTLWGRLDPTLPWTYVFLLGFEGHRSYGVWDRFEPRYVKAVIGKPGYKPGYTQLTMDANQMFLREAKPRRMYVDAGDAVATWRRIEKDIATDRMGSNICLVPLGPKSQALGGGLAAITDFSPAVLYLLPRSFKIRDVQRGKYIWLYEIVL